MPEEFPSEERLNSWKSIAAFLGKDERTVQRWELYRQLPVYRVPGRRGTVFAYKRELTAWLHGSHASSATEPLQDETQTSLQQESELTEEGSAAVPEGSTSAVNAPQRLSRWAALAVGICACFCLALLAHSYRAAKGKTQRPASMPSPTYFAPAGEHTLSQPAHEAYLKGRFYWEQRTPASLQLALQAFSEAVKLDPNYAAAYAGLAETYELMPEFNSAPASAAWPKALAAARMAVRLDPRSADAHRSLAFALFYWDWKTSAASQEFERANQLDPGNAETHHWYANAMLTLRRMDEAERQIRLARELNPSSKAIYADQILIDASSGVDPEVCVGKLRELLRTDPGFVSTPHYIENILFYSRHYEEWLSQLESSASKKRDPSAKKFADQAKEAWERGGEHMLLETVRAEEESDLKQGKGSAIPLVNSSFLLGDYAGAVGYLHQAYEMHDFQVLIVMSDPRYSVLAGDHRFVELRAEVQSQMKESSTSDRTFKPLQWWPHAT